MSIRIYGFSDDVIAVEAYGDRSDEFSGTNGSFLIGDERGGLHVRMRYGNHGTWAATVSLVDDQIPIPWHVFIENAPINGTNEGPYSVLVNIDCPIGTPWKKVRA